MKYRKLGNTGINVSAIGLGGHEFGKNDFILGWHDDSKKAIIPGFIFEGFGGENRLAIVKTALDLGINIFDLTIDSEIEAMGRILSKLQPSDEIIIQTRPQGMIYTYDHENRKMAQYDLLKAETVRLCGLLNRDHIDIYNFAFMQNAIDADPDYLDKICHNIARLKAEGLIRFACADTFSGAETYLEQFNTGCFDSTFTNYNIIEKRLREMVVPAACQKGIGIVCREAFMKAKLFKMAEEAGITDRSLTARSAIQWILKDERVACVMVGVANPEQLKDNCSVLEKAVDNYEEIINKIMQTQSFRSALRE